MKSITTCLFALLAAFGVNGACAQAVVGGVRYAETADLPSGKLRLNGAGVRYKAVFKVYAAGLMARGCATRRSSRCTRPAFT
jgi:hypothetical protein